MAKNSRRPSNSGIEYSKDTISVIESNVDDVTGEVLARLIEVSLDKGAYDATASPFVGKKGRPGFTVRITCDKKKASTFADILVRETGTLGVKIKDTERWIVKRSQKMQTVQLDGKSRRIRVKVASIDGRTKIKPELEDAKKLSNEFGIPLRSVFEIVSKQATEKV